MPGSPFSCKVNPGNTQPRIPVSGSGIELTAVGLPAEIKIDGVTGKAVSFCFSNREYAFYFRN